MQFYELGIDPMFEVSAEHGVGISDLLDEIALRLRKARARPGGAESEGGGAPRDRSRRKEMSVAIVGRPNAGKSSLVNRLLREERMLVSEMPGTTRDAVDAVLKWHKRDVPHRRHRGHPSRRAVWRAAASWNRSACWWRGAPSRTPTSSCWWWTPSGRHRSGRRDCR